MSDRDPYNYVLVDNLKARIAELEQWLASQKERIDQLVAELAVWRDKANLLLRTLDGENVRHEAQENGTRKTNTEK